MNVGIKKGFECKLALRQENHCEVDRLSFIIAWLKVDSKSEEGSKVYKVHYGVVLKKAKI